MKKDFLIIGIVIIVVAAGGFLGWRYFSFASLKSECQAVIDSEKIEIKLDLSKGVNLEESERIKEKILSIPGVLSFEFESEEKALADFKEKHKGDLFIEQALPDLVEDGLLLPYAYIDVDSTINLESLQGQIISKGLESGFTISSFLPDDTVVGARNFLGALSFSFPFGNLRESQVLKSCTEEGSAGLLKALLQES